MIYVSEWRDYLCAPWEDEDVEVSDACIVVRHAGQWQLVGAHYDFLPMAYEQYDDEDEVRIVAGAVLFAEAGKSLSLMNHFMKWKRAELMRIGREQMELENRDRNRLHRRLQRAARAFFFRFNNSVPSI